MIDADEALATTRSVRRRIDFSRPVSPQLLEECVEIAVQAPTGVGREAWRFVFVTEPELKSGLADLYRRAFDEFMELRLKEMQAAGNAPETLSPNYRFLADRLQDFPVLILVCTEGRPPEELSRQLGFYGSILPAAWSLMVALRTRGLGSTWTTLLGRHDREVAELLSIPPHVTPTVLLPVGHTAGATLRRAERRPASEVMYWNAWESSD